MIGETGGSDSLAQAIWLGFQHFFGWNWGLKKILTIWVSCGVRFSVVLNNGLWLGASFISLIPGSVVSDRLGSWNHHNPSSPHYSSAHFVHQLFSPFSPTTESGSRVLSHWPINSYSGLRLAVANFIVWSETRYNPKAYFEGSKHCFQPTLLNY